MIVIMTTISASWRHRSHTTSSSQHSKMSPPPERIELGFFEQSCRPFAPSLAYDRCMSAPEPTHSSHNPTKKRNRTTEEGDSSGDMGRNKKAARKAQKDRKRQAEEEIQSKRLQEQKAREDEEAAELKRAQEWLSSLPVDQVIQAPAFQDAHPTREAELNREFRANTPFPHMRIENFLGSTSVHLTKRDADCEWQTRTSWSA